MNAKWCVTAAKTKALLLGGWKEKIKSGWGGLLTGPSILETTLFHQDHQ